MARPTCQRCDEPIDPADYWLARLEHKADPASAYVPLPLCPSCALAVLSVAEGWDLEDEPAGADFIPFMN